MCASFVLDGGAEFGGAKRCEGVWHGGEEGVGVLAGAAFPEPYCIIVPHQ